MIITYVEKVVGLTEGFKWVSNLVMDEVSTRNYLTNVWLKGFKFDDL